VRLLPETLARRYRALILPADASGLLVGMADPIGAICSIDTRAVQLLAHLLSIGGDLVRSIA